jgi:MoxR-like ATPase/DNA-binding protein H-NS
MEQYENKHLSYLEDYEILQLLKSSWGFENNEPIMVFGKVVTNINKQTGRSHYRLYNVRSVKSNIFIDYPIKNINKKNTIAENGIYIPFIKKNILKELKNNSDILISFNLDLSSIEEREKQDNFSMVNAIPDTDEIVNEIDKHLIVYDGNTLLVKESILRILETKYKTEHEELFKKLSSETKYLQEQIENNDEKIKEYQNKLSLEFDNIQQKHLASTKKLNTDLLSLENEFKKKEKSVKKLDENKQKLQEEIKEKQQETNELISLIDELKVEIERINETMAKKLEKFRNFMKDKADQLLKLEFIDQEEYNDLLMANKEEKKDVKAITFKDDLSSNYQKAISHIHSYLFNQDIIYPRYIIEDFMALIQTNDLIILAGESGSGKTNLVKSFAKAIGGKSFIIPVKPNWTSAEDLLGYYNPLEKKYLTTPFLEALLEAKNNPDIPYFICLDEMNLARVEYYFADFLSLLEERDTLPEIQLYSDDESSHVLSEFKNVLEIINSVKEKYKKNNLVDFVSILKDEEVNNELKRVFGFSDKDSLIKYHTDLRKMISGIINTPSSIKFPPNVRIVGAINIDETTHYLSPKILDRAHIMKFDSPLLYDWTIISNEIEQNEKKDYVLKFEIDELGRRVNYPSYDKDDLFCQIITSFTKDYFQPLGIEVGLRTIRQGLNYQNIFKEQESNESLVLNNFILHKILPKMTFDWKKKVDENRSKEDLLLEFHNILKDKIDEKLVNAKSINAINELNEIITASRSNDGIVNYWA